MEELVNFIGTALSVNSTLLPSSARNVTGIYENRVYPGIPKLLRDLLGAGKVLLLATSKPTPYSIQILAHFHLDHFKLWVAILTAAGPKKQKSLPPQLLRHNDGA